MDGPAGMFWKFPVVVKRVTDSSGAELEFSHKYNELMILLPEALAPGSSATVTVGTSGYCRYSLERGGL